MITIEAYRENVAAALAEWIAAGSTVEKMPQLATLLGCRHPATRYPSAGYVTAVEPGQPDSSFESVTRSALLTMLRQYDSTIIVNEDIAQVIGDGLVRNGRWRACLDDIDSAYKFADLLLRVFESFMVRRPRQSAVKDLHHVLRGDLGVVLKAWLAPYGLAQPNNRQELAKTMFGELWFDLVLSDLKPRDSIAEIVRVTRPRFIAGLVPAQKAVEQYALPTLDT